MCWVRTCRRLSRADKSVWICLHADFSTVEALKRLSFKKVFHFGWLKTRNESGLPIVNFSVIHLISIKIGVKSICNHPLPGGASDTDKEFNRLQAKLKPYSRTASNKNPGEDSKNQFVKSNFPETSNWNDWNINNRGVELSRVQSTRIVSSNRHYIPEYSVFRDANASTSSFATDKFACPLDPNFPRRDSSFKTNSRSIFTVCFDVSPQRLRRHNLLLLPLLAPVAN